MFIRSIVIMTLSLLLVFDRTATAQVTSDANGIVYVKTGGDGSQNGSSWGNALPELADALKAAKEQNDLAPGTIKEIWVAKGTYKPRYRADNLDGSNPQDRNNAFVLVSEVKLYGGFDPDNGVTDKNHARVLPGASSESPTDATVLSGDIDGDGTLNSGNAYHVVISAGDVGTALLDGFVIAGGYADGTTNITVNGTPAIPNYGGGVFVRNSSPALNNISITENKAYSATLATYGGGMYSNSSFSVLSNVNISKNEVETDGGSTNNLHAFGGGFYSTGSTSVTAAPILTNVNIRENTGKTSSGTGQAHGGGIYNAANSSAILTDVRIIGNTAYANNSSAYAGGMFNNTSEPVLTNVIIEDNTASSPVAHAYGGGLYSTGSANGNAAPVLTNVIVRDNMAVTEATSASVGTARGGGMFSTNTSSSVLINVLIAGNSASAVASTAQGGGLYVTATADIHPTLTNVTISGNSIEGITAQGEEWYNMANSVIRNSIVYGNGIFIGAGYNDSQLNNSLVQTRNPGGNNINSNTISNINDLFVNVDNGDFTLAATSSAINAGANGFVTVTTDLAGNARIRDNTVDMGAYEHQQGNTVAVIRPDAQKILYVKQGASNGNTGGSWADALPELAEALKWAHGNKEAGLWSDTEPLRIYVAKGTYKPLYSPQTGANFGTDQGRDNAFLMVNNVQIFGGFDPDNGITDLADRVLPSVEEVSPANATVLSGDIDNNNTLDDGNVYHVVISAGDVGEALLDGFVVTGGYADGTTNISVNGTTAVPNYGAGFFVRNSSPVLRNVSIINNTATSSTPTYGGAMYNNAASPTLTNVIISGNTASSSAAVAYGGGIYNTASSPILTHVSLLDNTVSSSTAHAYGGGIYAASASSPVLTNVIIKGNTASTLATAVATGTARGGGIFSNGSSPVLTNVLVVGNTISAPSSTAQGGGIYTATTEAIYPIVTNVTVSGNTATGTTVAATEWYNLANSQVRNTIVYGTSVTPGATYIDDNAQNSLIQGRNVTANGNIAANTIGSVNDLFVDPANGDFSLKSGSPVIDKGNNSLFAGLDSDTKDLAGNLRVYNGTIDLGAYEYFVPNVETLIDPDVVSVDYGTSWENVQGLPTHVVVTFNNDAQFNAPLAAVTAWIPVGTVYDEDIAGDYVLSAPLLLPSPGQNPYYTNTADLQATVTVRVKKGVLDLTLDDAGYTYDGSAKSLAVSGTIPSGVNVSYTINGQPGNEATAIGVYTVVAEVDGGANYENMTLTGTLTIEEATLDNITLTDASYTYDSMVKTLSISGVMPPGSSVSYTINGQPGNSATNAGIYTVVAELDGGGIYTNRTLTATLTINKATISGVMLTDANHTYDGLTKTLSISGDLPSGSSVEYTIDGQPGNSATDVGVYTVIAEINGGNNYENQTYTATLSIQLATRTISFATLPDKAYGDADFILEATASTGEQVLFSSSNPSVATVDGNTVKIIGIGETVITATVAEDPNYGNTPIIQRTLRVTKASQHIDFIVPEKVARDIGRLSLLVSASSGLPVTLALEDASRATLEGTELYIQHSLGAIRITATQPGDGHFEPADPVTVVIRVVDESIENFVRLHPAVSPNGDGVNDFLIIDRIQDYPENKLLIHDSEGRIVFEAEGYDNAQTVFRGDGLADGTYFYHLEITINGQRKQTKGFIQLRRN